MITDFINSLCKLETFYLDLYRNEYKRDFNDNTFGNFIETLRPTKFLKNFVLLLE